MSTAPAESALPARLNDLALFATLVGLAGILTTAMVFQYASDELPCPLCLLQRVAMFGTCFGIILHFRHGYSGRNIGLSLIWALFLLIVSARQVLMVICPRPGHAYPGSAILDLHMPVWSVVIAVALLASFAIELALFGDERLREGNRPWAVTRLAGWLSLYVIILCVANLASAALQCGFDACHTTGYKLL